MAGKGQVDAEGGAFAGRAFDRDRAAVLLDDPVSNGQTEAGAFSHVLGGEEWIEDASLKAGRNSVPGIDECDLQYGDADRSRNANHLPRRVEYRVARVGQQVDEHLLELDGIADDHGLFRAEFERHFDLMQAQLLLHK